MVYTLLCVFCSFISCKTGPVDPEPIIPPPPPPPIVTLEVPATAGYLQDITISWSSINAKTVTKSFVNGTEVTGSFIVKGITQTTTFSVTAHGDGGVSTVEKTVSVRIPTGADTLMSHGWKLVAREFWTKSTNTIRYSEVLSSEQLTSVLYFKKDNYASLVDSTGKEYSNGFWSLIGKIYKNGDQIYNLILLNDEKFQFSQTRQSDDLLIKVFYEKAR